MDEKTETGNTSETENEELTRELILMMRRCEEHITAAVPQGPLATMDAVTDVMQELGKVRVDIAMALRATVIEQMFREALDEDCGNPDCPNHEEARAEAAAQASTAPSSETSSADEQPGSDPDDHNEQF